MSYLRDGNDVFFDDMLPPDGWPALYEDKLEQLFASSPTMQAALAKTPQEIRTNHIFNDSSWYVEESGLLQAYRPLIVFQEIEFAITRDTFTAQRSQGNLHSGTVHFLITDNAVNPGSTNPVDHKLSKRTFVVFVGGILRDVERVAGQDDNLGFRSIEMVERYHRTPVGKQRTESHDIWEVVFSIQFGYDT